MKTCGDCYWMKVKYRIAICKKKINPCVTYMDLFLVQDKDRAWEMAKNCAEFKDMRG